MNDISHMAGAALMIMALSELFLVVPFLALRRSMGNKLIVISVIAFQALCCAVAGVAIWFGYIDLN